MSKEFTRTFRVRWSETNALGEVGLAGYLRYLVETAWDWGASGGLSIAENEALGLAWIVHEMELSLHRPLVANELFDFTIWLLQWRRVRGTRCFELRLKDGGELVAQGTQQVVALDGATLRPTRVPEHLMDNFVMENPRIIEQQKFPAFQAQPEGVFMSQRVVDWRDLDVQEHVNNAAYAEFAEQAAVQAFETLGWSPDRFKAQDLAVRNRRLHIQYKAPALWGDTLNVETSLLGLKPKGGVWVIEIKRANDGETVTRCILEWSLADRSSNIERTLPENLYQVLKERSGSAQPG